MELKPPPFVLVLPEKISCPKEILKPPSLLPPMTLSFCTYQPRPGLSALKLVRAKVSNSSDSEALTGRLGRASRIMPRESIDEYETNHIRVVEMLLYI